MTQFNGVVRQLHESDVTFLEKTGVCGLSAENNLTLSLDGLVAVKKSRLQCFLTAAGRRPW